MRIEKHAKWQFWYLGGVHVSVGPKETSYKINWGPSISKCFINVRHISECQYLRKKTVISKGKILVRLLGYMLVDRAMNFSVEKN